MTQIFFVEFYPFTSSSHFSHYGIISAMLILTTHTCTAEPRNENLIRCRLWSCTCAVYFSRHYWMKDRLDGRRLWFRQTLENLGKEEETSSLPRSSYTIIYLRFEIRNFNWTIIDVNKKASETIKSSF